MDKIKKLLSIFPKILAKEQSLTTTSSKERTARATDLKSFSCVSSSPGYHREGTICT